MKKISQEQYQNLMESSVNAWALWEKDSMRFPNRGFSDLQSSLKPNIILLGLNPSKELKYRNFHSNSAGDKRLKESIQGEENSYEDQLLKNISGAFMTDLVHTQIKSDSNLVQIPSDAFSEFEKILEKLGQKEYKIICFGGKVYEAAKGWLLNERQRDHNIVECDSAKSIKRQVNLYKVMHYSYRYDVNVVGAQLSYLDNQF